MAFGAFVTTLLGGFAALRLRALRAGQVFDAAQLARALDAPGPPPGGQG